jgi:hypothetical protein
VGELRVELSTGVSSPSEVQRLVIVRSLGLLVS